MSIVVVYRIISFYVCKYVMYISAFTTINDNINNINANSEPSTIITKRRNSCCHLFILHKN